MSTTETFHFEDTYQRACELFHDTPSAAQEQTLLDAFERGPRFVNDLIDRIATDVASGKINSGWAVTTKRLTLSPRQNLTVTDKPDRQRAADNAERWIENAGVHFDRETELLDELFGDTGRLRQWRNDQELRQQMLNKWRTLRPLGEQAERELEERLAGYAEKRAAIIAAQRNIRTQAAPTGLNPASEGDCDDCTTTGDRWHYGRFLLCAKCATTRQAVAKRLEREHIPGDLERGLPITEVIRT
jgi:hypothetical protein